MKALVVAGLLLLSGAAAITDVWAVDFDATQVRRIIGHGPWPPAETTDRTNRYSGNTDAIRLGAMLFGEPRLSGNAAINCQTCHRPEHGWSEPKARSEGLQRQDRNAPGLLNARLQRWFGWDGANDSLWAAGIRPIVNATEMGGSAAATAKLLREDAPLACLARRIEPAYATMDDEAVLVLAGKALAALKRSTRRARRSTIFAMLWPRMTGQGWRAIRHRRSAGWRCSLGAASAAPAIPARISATASSMIPGWSSS